MYYVRPEQHFLNEIEDITCLIADKSSHRRTLCNVEDMEDFSFVCVVYYGQTYLPSLILHFPQSSDRSPLIQLCITQSV